MGNLSLITTILNNYLFKIYIQQVTTVDCLMGKRVGETTFMSQRFRALINTKTIINRRVAYIPMQDLVIPSVNVIKKAMYVPRRYCYYAFLFR